MSAVKKQKRGKNIAIHKYKCVTEFLKCQKR